MAVELVIRFIVGGLVVSAFAVLGEVLRPKTFAGLFGAAPSVALATLGLTFFMKGGTVASVEGRAMLAGACALFLYSLALRWVLLRRQWSAMIVAGAMWIQWLAVAFALWAAVLR